MKVLTGPGDPPRKQAGAVNPGSESACSAPQRSLADLCDDCVIEVLSRVPSELRPILRLICRRFRGLVDSRLCPQLRIDGASHLAGGRLSGTAVYGSQTEFTTAAARVLAQRAGGLLQMELDFDAYGCVFASQLLTSQPLPRLRCVALLNAEPQHVAALRGLPRLRDVCLGRHINGPVSAGPAAEALVAQLSGLPLRSLRLGGYRMLPGILGSIADALPELRELALEVERVEQQGRLELGALPRLGRLRRWELRLLGGRASASGVTVAPLPPGSCSLAQLSSLELAHVRPGQGEGEGEGEEEAFWRSLALLPALRSLAFTESGHRARQPPHALLQLHTLTSLHIQIEGSLHNDDPPLRTWTQLPELPQGALPCLASLRVDCVGLLGFPASWCRLPLQELIISGRASERCFYSLTLPEQLPALAPALRRLELPRCGLLALPDQVAQLTGLTHLNLSRNNIARLPLMKPLQQLQELNVWANPVGNAAQALQGCHALHRLVLGSAGLVRRRMSECGEASAAAYEDDEAWRWEEAWLSGIRAQLPWVPQVASAY